MKNSIWYRFSSEKVSYEIKFDTIDISIKDIKQKIIKRRNMIKYPERFDLIFYDEENPEIKINEKDLIKPMKHLIVKRLPHYSLENTFKSEIKDPKEIPMNKINENGLKRGELQQITRYTEPLEKISKFIRKDLLNKQFKCKYCEKFDEDTYNNFIISKCCKETFCLNCYNKDEKCPSCKNDKIGFVKNESEINLIKKLLDILEKKEEQEKIKKEKALMLSSSKNSIINSNSDINQKNGEINNPLNKGNSSNNNIGNILRENINQEPLTSYQLQKQLLEESQFYIIKSSNVDNIQKSQSNSVWATTMSNSNRLNQAFSKGKVILIFSINGNQNFKGYAIMTSYSADTPSNIWKLDNTSIKLGGNFSVSWLCYCELPFSKTKFLNVNKSRDCTELDQKTGITLCDLCYEQEKDELDKNPQRIKAVINEQSINKINETISNNKNKQKEKTNNNKNQQTNEQNKTQSQLSINNNEKNDIPTQNPGMIYNPAYYLMFNQAYQKQYMMQWQQMQLQMQKNNQNNYNMINQQQQQQQQKEQKQENEKKENKEETKSRKSRHTKRRSRSRDRSRSRSRNRNKSRSSRSRRSNSSSSRSEGRSKYSKSYK